MDENYQRYLELIENFYQSKNHYLGNKDKHLKCDGCKTDKQFIESQKEEARKEAESIIAKAKEAMELERQNVLKDAREEIASLVIMTTTKVLSRDLSDDEKKRFTESAIASTSS